MTMPHKQNDLMTKFNEMDTYEQKSLFNLAIKALSYEVHLDFLQDIQLLQHIYDINQTPEVGFLLAYYTTHGKEAYEEELASAFKLKRINASSHQLRILPRQHELNGENRLFSLNRTLLQERQRMNLPFTLHLEPEKKNPTEDLFVKVIATYDNQELYLGYLSKEETRLLACPLQSNLPYYSQIKFHDVTPNRTRTPEIYVLFLKELAA